MDKLQQILAPLEFQKISQLISRLKDRNVIVAFSGGVDSSTLAWFVANFASKSVAITVESELTPSDEIVRAKKVAKEIKITHKVISITRFSNPDIMKNDQMRCYYCKLQTFSLINEYAHQNGFDLVVDGSNATDLGDYRPGMKALQELKIRSPFLEVQITKTEIREIAHAIGLSIAQSPSMACLITRIPYGEELTLTKVQHVAQAEAFLQQELQLEGFRVRSYNDSLARIEVSKDKIPIILANSAVIVEKFKKIGFHYITLDLEGYISGSMDKVIEIKKVQLNKIFSSF